jgi:hypothetical protein
VIFPSKMDLLANRSPEGQYFTALAREFNVPALPLLPTLDANRRPNPYYVYDGHLSEAGNKAAAIAVWDWMFDEPGEFPALRSAANGPTAARMNGHR